MSRIDQALRRREATVGSAVAEAEPLSEPRGSAAAAALNQYAEELRNRHEPAVPSPETPSTSGSSFDAAAVGSEHQSVAGWRSRRAPDIEARLVTNPANAVSTEQYRRMAATLHELQSDKQLKTAMVTSAVPQEGKTLTLVNLGLTLSESYGRRVLMIDADLRKPSLHYILGVQTGRGLWDALREPRPEFPFVPVSERLSVLTAGHPSGMPLAVLSSPRMQEIIDECAAQFDWVLVDTSPVGILPDAMVLARLVEGVIFVIRAGSTPSVVVERAIGEIGADAIIGTVLNRVERHRIRSASYYNQYPTPRAAR